MNFEFFIKIVIVIVALFIWLIGSAAKKAKREQEKLVKNKNLNTPPGNLDAGQEYSLSGLNEMSSSNYFKEKPVVQKEKEKTPPKTSAPAYTENTAPADFTYSSIPDPYASGDAEGVLFELTNESILSAIIMKEILEPRGGRRSF